MPLDCLASYAEPILQPESRITDGTAFHECDEIEDVAAQATASRRGTRAGMTCPRVLLGIDNEALLAAFR
jgi:hypothetical protein